MRTPQQQLRCLIDKLYKKNKELLPTGKDRRMQEEAMHSSAAAKGMARMRGKKRDVMRTVPLDVLQKKRMKG